VVYRARYLGMPVALKTCALACNSFGSVQPGLAERFWTELVNHAAARHPFITNVYGGYVDPRNPALHCMVVELCDGTLARALLGATVLQRLTWMKQVLSALSHLHAHGTIHTDIKTENVLLGTDGRAKVMDFGMSHMRGTASSLSTTTVSSSRLGAQGTPAYMAPEVLTKTAPVSRRTDVYSAGVLLWVMATRQEPYDGLSTDMDAFARMVVSGTRPSPSSELPKLMADAGMPPQLGELISAMWDGDASKRPTMAECFNATRRATSAVARWARLRLRVGLRRHPRRHALDAHSRLACPRCHCRMGWRWRWRSDGSGTSRKPVRRLGEWRQQRRRCEWWRWRVVEGVATML
jgi:serine/threonine protein kinase